jgi:hypothetical protein
MVSGIILARKRDNAHRAIAGDLTLFVCPAKCMPICSNMRKKRATDITGSSWAFPQNIRISDLSSVPVFQSRIRITKPEFFPIRYFRLFERSAFCECRVAFSDYFPFGQRNRQWSNLVPNAGDKWHRCDLNANGTKEDSGLRRRKTEPDSASRPGQPTNLESATCLRELIEHERYLWQKTTASRLIRKKSSGFWDTSLALWN